MNITAEIDTKKLGDSYVIKDSFTRQTSCFSLFNNIMACEYNTNPGSIILEKDKIDQLGIKDLKYYLENIKLAGTLDFQLIDKDNELYIEFDITKCRLKSYYQYTGMLVRCAYKNRSDDFLDISKHFIKMCRYFPKKDRGMLFTIACNIYLACNEKGSYSRYNSNHILMYNSGCKILKTKDIIKLLDQNNGINENFTISNELHDPDKVYIIDEITGLKKWNDKNPAKYNPDLFKKQNYILEDDTKKSYSKIIKLNGIK